ncbi:hypothetical protein JWZ98_03190 [Methylomonas sp. EFPC1]|uniref:phage terminase small subunit n=1 Tax=Methylomonas sp. EFPC1 TaxID=2812647 RepID=UPI00196804B2|nr:phage terminase small subunit [Methylomonas sp. EFPC1]QSB01980.1 hypothetical protein JWZ98_03190 [Methylomonas sp. EFPC1]
MSKIAAIKQQQLEAAARGLKPAVAEPSPDPVRKLQAVKAVEPPYQPREPESAPGEVVHGDLAHYQAAMDADIANLSPIKDLAEKAVAKQRMIETYWGFVKAYMDNGDNYPNSVAVRVMVWLFDTLDIERGLELAFHLIKQGVHVSPPKFDRDIPTFVCDAVYDWAAALLKTEPPQSASPYLDALVATIDNDAWSLAPPVQSKMYVILAKHKKRSEEWQTVLALCEKAEAVNPEGAGVKGLKTTAQAKLKAVDKAE